MEPRDEGALGLFGRGKKASQRRQLLNGARGHLGSLTHAPPPVSISRWLIQLFHRNIESALRKAMESKVGAGPPEAQPGSGQMGPPMPTPLMHG